MTIVEALKEKEIDRVSKGDRWMYWDIIYSEWMIAEYKPYAKKTTILYQGRNEEKAVEYLLNG